MAARSSIYVISEGKSGPVKVGRSTGTYLRRMALQTGNPRPLRLVAEWSLSHDDALTAERLLKEELNTRALLGEWFDAGESFILDFMGDLFLAHGLEAHQ